MESTRLQTEDQFYEFLAGCGKAMMLTAAIDLGLDGLLVSRGPLTGEEIREALALHPMRCRKFLLILDQVGLVVKQVDGKYVAGPLLKAFVDPEVMYFYREFLRYWRVSVVRDTVGVLRGAPVLNPVRYPPVEDADVALLHDWMRSGAYITLHIIEKHFNFLQVTRYLDVGGGDSTMAIALASKFAHLEPTVFNIPKAADMGRQNIKAANLEARVTVVEGNFLRDPLPKENYDLVMFSRVLADWPPEVCQKLLSEAAAALAPGGRLLIAEPFADDNPALAVTWEHSYLTYDDFGVHCYKSTEFYKKLITEAGFTDVEVHHREQSIHGVMLATKKK